MWSSILSQNIHPTLDHFSSCSISPVLDPVGRVSSVTSPQNHSTMWSSIISRVITSHSTEYLTLSVEYPPSPHSSTTRPRTRPSSFRVFSNPHSTRHLSIRKRRG
ncbi:unnamed protein product [Arabidopsis halleri]